MGFGLSKKAKEAYDNCKRNGGINLNFEDCGVEKMKNFKAILKLPRLVKLDLSRNNIRDLPKKFNPLKQLEEFILSRNLIGVLGDGILVLDTLKILKIDRNKLKELPNNFSKLASLEELNISYNEIKTLPSDFGNLNKLKILNFDGTELKAIPLQVWDLKGLQELTFIDNNLTIVNKELTKFSGTLIKLDISQNQIDDLGETIGTLVNLEFLNVSNNRITQFSKEITKCTKLKMLMANECKITSLDSIAEGMENWAELSEIQLSANQLKTVPPQMKNIKKLKHLDLSKNQIETLPKQLFWLKATLRKLLLNNNKIKSLPGDVSYLDPSLKLTLENNPLDSGPQQAYESGIVALVEYYSMKVGACPPNCVAVGESIKRARVAKPQDFYIKCYSIENKEITTKTIEEFEGYLLDSNNNKTNLIIKNNNNGTYSAYFSTQKSGKYKIFVSGNDEQIKGSPYETYVEPEPVPSQEKSVISGMVNELKPGSQATLNVELYDRWGNRMDVGGNPPEVIVKGEGTKIDADVDDNGDGSYVIHYTVGFSGRYKVSVTIKGEHLPGSPFDVVCK
eukprot:TRINITY_DN604_c4_g1_i1.p1 TRINITY_DN604_c4_g1~~TRINITY_DN604_c4_g1_i1.p1  ORF type:complete len:565 (+),score=171.79 TRINITY_DN604_c4_g1_i1:3-1697(+)